MSPFIVYIFTMANILTLSLKNHISLSLSLSLSFWHAAQLLADGDRTDDGKITIDVLVNARCQGCDYSVLLFFKTEISCHGNERIVNLNQNELIHSHFPTFNLFAPGTFHACNKERSVRP
jgi:hypothetical protein